MTLFKVTAFVGMLAIPFTSIAGLWGTTIHSRANCYNNESIT